MLFSVTKFLRGKETNSKTAGHRFQVWNGTEVSFPCTHEQATGVNAVPIIMSCCLKDPPQHCSPINVIFSVCCISFLVLD